MNNLNIIHTMIRVKDLEESISFYKGILGMNLNKKTDYKEGKFTLAFLGYGDIATHPQIELTYNWDKNNYELGDAFGHIAISTSDIVALCQRVKEQGGKVVREPAAMKFGKTIIAFIEDPNGYKIELIEKTT
ncbi:Lactoylglutathione lyase [Candidatus Hepatincola sp. Pdp]